jgi:hypothetical protein
MNTNAQNDNAIIVIRQTNEFAVFTYEGDGTEYRKKIQRDGEIEFITVDGMQYILNEPEETDTDETDTDTAEIDALVQQHTAFKSLDEMCNQINYFPSLNAKFHQRIADAYDTEMERRGDARRAHRYITDEQMETEYDHLIIQINHEMWQKSIVDLNEILTTLDLPILTEPSAEQRQNGCVIAVGTNGFAEIGDALKHVFFTSDNALIDTSPLTDDQREQIGYYLTLEKAA